MAFILYWTGNSYNIPICLWILDSHPFAPPICFLKPTANMGIAVGKHVDARGRIYLPYLQNWSHVRAAVADRGGNHLGILPGCHVELSSRLRILKAVRSDFKEKKDWFFTKQWEPHDTLLHWVVRPVEYPSGKFNESFCLLGMSLLAEFQKSMLLLNDSMHCIKLFT